MKQLSNRHRLRINHGKQIRFAVPRRSSIYLLRLLILSMFFLVPRENLYAQKSNGGASSSAGANVGTTTAAAFLELGVGARAQAMGGAFSSLAQDVTAMYWNPAGLAKIKGLEASFTHISWLVDTDFDYAGMALPIGEKGALGVSVTIFGTDEQPVRVIGQEEGTGEFYDALDLAAGVTFALNLTDRFSFGVSAKYIQQRIWHSTARGFGIDVGGLYETLFDGLQMGFSISNFGSDMSLSGRDLRNVLDPDILNEGVDNIPVTYETDSFTLPQLFRFGLSYRTPMLIERSTLTLAADLLHPNNDEESINLGAEYLMAETFALRAGYRSLFLSDRTGGLSLGTGFIIPTRSDMTINIDYAYVDYGILNAVHNFSLSLKF